MGDENLADSKEIHSTTQALPGIGPIRGSDGEVSADPADRAGDGGDEEVSI